MTWKPLPRLSRWALPLAVLLALPGCTLLLWPQLFEEQAVPKGQIQGTATVGVGEPIPYAEVRVPGAARQRRAGADGRFTVADMLPGPWVLLLTEDRDGDGWPDRSRVLPTRVTEGALATSPLSLVTGPTGEPVVSGVELGEVELSPTVTLAGTVDLDTIGPSWADDYVARVVVSRSETLPLTEGAADSELDLGAVAVTSVDSEGDWQVEGVGTGTLYVTAVLHTRQPNNALGPVVGVSAAVKVDAQPTAETGVAITVDPLAVEPQGAVPTQEVTLLITPAPLDEVYVIFNPPGFPRPPCEATYPPLATFQANFPDAVLGDLRQPSQVQQLAAPQGSWDIIVCSGGLAGILYDQLVRPSDDVLTMGPAALGASDNECIGWEDLGTTCTEDSECTVSCGPDEADSTRCRVTPRCLLVGRTLLGAPEQHCHAARLDCDGDALEALPELGTLDPGDAQACLSTCAALVGSELSDASCTIDGTRFDCDDDGDGQADLTEWACYGPGLGTDLDQDGLCSTVDSFPQCAANNAADCQAGTNDVLVGATDTPPNMFDGGVNMPDVDGGSEAFELFDSTFLDNGGRLYGSESSDRIYTAIEGPPGIFLAAGERYDPSVGTPTLDAAVWVFDEAGELLTTFVMGDIGGDESIFGLAWDDRIGVLYAAGVRTDTVGFTDTQVVWAFDVDTGGLTPASVSARASWTDGQGIPGRRHLTDAIADDHFGSEGRGVFLGPNGEVYVVGQVESMFFGVAPSVWKVDSTIGSFGDGITTVPLPATAGDQSPSAYIGYSDGDRIYLAGTTDDSLQPVFVATLDDASGAPVNGLGDGQDVAVVPARSFPLTDLHAGRYDPLGQAFYLSGTAADADSGAIAVVWKLQPSSATPAPDALELRAGALPEAFAFDVALLGDAMVVVGSVGDDDGLVGPAGYRDMALWILDTDGVPDTTYGPGGLALDAQAANVAPLDVATRIVKTASGQALIFGVRVADGVTETLDAKLIWKINEPIIDHSDDPETPAPPEPPADAGTDPGGTGDEDAGGSLIVDGCNTDPASCAGQVDCSADPLLPAAACNVATNSCVCAPAVCDGLHAAVGDVTTTFQLAQAVALAQSSDINAACLIGSLAIDSDVAVTTTVTTGPFTHITGSFMLNYTGTMTALDLSGLQTVGVDFDLQYNTDLATVAVGSVQVAGDMRIYGNLQVCTDSLLNSGLLDNVTGTVEVGGNGCGSSLGGCLDTCYGTEFCLVSPPECSLP